MYISYWRQSRFIGPLGGFTLTSNDGNKALLEKSRKVVFINIITSASLSTNMSTSYIWSTLLIYTFSNQKVMHLPYLEDEIINLTHLINLQNIS